MYGLLLLNLIIGNGSNGIPAVLPVIFIFFFVALFLIKIAYKFSNP
jgi:hypothetical protein